MSFSSAMKRFYSLNFGDLFINSNVLYALLFRPALPFLIVRANDDNSTSQKFQYKLSKFMLMVCWY